MAQNNATILAKAYLAGTNDYQQRIPDVTQAGVEATMNALFDPMNKQYFNQFMDFLINRVAYTVVKGKVFNNPLSEFKKDKVNYGSTIQEIAFKWLKAHTYDDVDESLLKLNRPEGVSWYHSQNRRDRYDISIIQDELRTATTEEYGLNNIVAKLLELPENSDNYDEFQIMKNILATYETNLGFHRHVLAAEPTDEASGKTFLTAVMSDGGRMKFPSTLYNAQAFQDIPTFITDEELILITTPEVMANINVQTYAAMFNMDVAKAQARIVLVDDIPIPGAFALLTTRDIFECHDTVLQMDNFWNPKRLSNEYFLHHWGIYSLSPFVPAVLYTVGDPADVPVITQAVTGMTVSPAIDTVRLGSKTKINVTLTGTISPETDGIIVAPNAATYSLALTAAGGADSTSALNSRTYVDNAGVLHVQKSGLADGDTITIYAAATYKNPTTAEDKRETASTTVTINSGAPVLPASVTVAPTSAAMTTVGGTVQLTATVLPADATDKTVTWKSDDDTVATVSATGLVTAVAAGTTHINATTSNGKTVAVEATVTVG